MTTQGRKKPADDRPVFANSTPLHWDESKLKLTRKLLKDVGWLVEQGFTTTYKWGNPGYLSTRSAKLGVYVKTPDNREVLLVIASTATDDNELSWVAEYTFSEARLELFAKSVLSAHRVKPVEGRDVKAVMEAALLECWAMVDLYKNARHDRSERARTRDFLLARRKGKVPACKASECVCYASTKEAADDDKQ